MKKLVKKEPKKLLMKSIMKKIWKKSINELKEIAKLRRIKNSRKLKKEALITSILKSESSNTERNYMKHFNINTKDDTYDSKIRVKISEIRMILSKLGNTITINDEKKIKEELHEIEKKKNLWDNENKEIYDHLVKLVRTLDKKEKFKYHDCNDLDYHGLRNIENLFDSVNDIDYYKPMLVKSSFKENYKYYEIRGDKEKKLSIE